MSDPFWSEKIDILINSNRLVEFYPSQDMTNAEKLNALVRLSIYIGLIITVYKGSLLYLLLPAAVALLTLFIYSYSKEYFTDLDYSDCTLPTYQNPFMNNLYGDEPDKPVACNTNDPNIKNLRTKYFTDGVYVDATDPFYT